MGLGSGAGCDAVDGVLLEMQMKGAAGGDCSRRGMLLGRTFGRSFSAASTASTIAFVSVGSSWIGLATASGESENQRFALRGAGIVWNPTDSMMLCVIAFSP